MISSGFFSSASQFTILGGQFIHNNDRAQEDPNKHLMLLYNQVSPNAILNSGGRVDPVKCFPGTREEVIGRLDLWMTSGYVSDRRIFWLSGPAGAGKSAIVQTIAELWIERNAAVATFFIFRADPLRNDTRPVVATLLFQILSIYPELKPRIISIIADNPVILRQSARTQFQRLVYEPVSSIRQGFPTQPPIILLIDGLDECESQSAKEDQRSLLYLLHNLTMPHNSPFIVLVASRPEPHLVMAFNEIGTFHNSIFLDGSYRPVNDIKRFIVSELASIKKAHHLGQFLNKDWPSNAIITSIINKSSGQFIYAATVARFIRNSSASPEISMQTVLGLRQVKKVSPFRDIDAIYAHILSQAEDWNAVRDILATDKILRSLPRFCGMTPLAVFLYIDRGLSAMGYTRNDIRSHLSDLTSITELEERRSGYSVQFYHASLDDFLYDRTRAGRFYVDLNPVACNLMAAHFRETPNLTTDTLMVILHIFRHITKPSDAVTQVLRYKNLLDVPFYPRRDRFHETYKALPSLFLAKVDELYQQKDPQIHKSIVSGWHAFFLTNKIGLLDPTQSPSR